MTKIKYSKRSKLFLISIGVLIGVIFWLTIAAVLAWFISSGQLNEQIGTGIIPLLQGIVALVITILTHIGLRGESMILSALTPLVYLFTQIVVSLLFWEVDPGALFTGAIATACGAILALVISHMKKKTTNFKHFSRYSR